MNWTRSYAGYSRSQPKEVRENPALGARLEKIKKEELTISTQEFVESLLEFFKKKGGLTENQLTAFEKIESRWSPQEKEKLQAWNKEYLEHHLETAKIIAKYYTTAGYFSNIAVPILDDPEFIPPKHSYKKMSTNKYARKVLEETTRQPKFVVNDMVQIRSTAGRNNAAARNLISYQNRLCFVLSNSLPVISACAGGKRYKVLPMGSEIALDLEERQLMNPNKKGKVS